MMGEFETDYRFVVD